MTKIIRLKREAMLYRFIAFADVILFVALLTEGILNGLANALSIMAIAMGFFNLLIGIGAEQRTKAIKWALWYYENRHLIRRYHEKHGQIKLEEIETETHH